MKVRMTKRRLAVVVASTVALMVGGGLAYAYWTSTGTGTGSATTGTSTDFVFLNMFTATDPPLTPGGPGQAVTFQVNNPATSWQMLNSVVVTVANPDGTPWGDVPGCSADDYTVGPNDIPSREMNGGETWEGHLTITMNDLATNQDACKNVTVPLYFLAS